MLRTLLRVAGPYRVTFSSEVWRRIGQMPSDAFQALQAALEKIAEAMGEARPVGESEQTELRATVEGLLITYQRDDATRTIILLDVRSASSER
jgi:hypothetical protein